MCDFLSPRFCRFALSFSGLIVIVSCRFTLMLHYLVKTQKNRQLLATFSTTRQLQVFTMLEQLSKKICFILFLLCFVVSWFVANLNRSFSFEGLVQTLLVFFPSSQTFKVPASTPVGPESWLGDDDITTFTGISYLGSLKVKKSYLLINESITSLLEKAHPKEFKNTFVEVHANQIRIIDSRDNKIIHQHAIPWILLLGVYDQDTRLFGYIVSDARQGEKTRMICHAFRCSRITTSVAVTEAIRLGCQATYSERRDSVRSSRRISFISDSSSGGSLETMSSPPNEHLDSTVCL